MTQTAQHTHAFGATQTSAHLFGAMMTTPAQRIFIQEPERDFFSFSQINPFTRSIKFLNVQLPHLTKFKGVTIQLKALDEYFLMVVFTL